ncbi:MAG: hypothetical protein LUE27_02755 [Clostridia bacterium]|nr:hypothetical protein [Clostridia bacterium]
MGNRIECHMRLGAVYDLRNHLIVDAACNPYIYVDRNLAIYEQIKSIPEYIGVDHPYITVLDSSCESLPLIVRLLASGKKFAVMLKNNGFFEDELHSMRADDEDIVINPVRYRSEFISETDEPYMRSHAWAFRIVTVWYKGQRASLATNLSREEFPQEAFRELYNLRWGDKAGFRHLQKRLQIKQFTGTRCATLLQDIFGIIYIANTAEDVARDYAELAGLDLTFIDCVQSRLVNRLIDFATLKNDLIYALLVDSEEKSEVMTKLYQDIEDRIKQGIKG